MANYVSTICGSVACLLCSQMCLSIDLVCLFLQTCYICEEQGRESKAATGACMACNKHGCRQAFHVTW